MKRIGVIVVICMFMQCIGNFTTSADIVTATASSIVITGNQGELLYTMPKTGIIEAHSIVTNGEGVLALVHYGVEGKIKQVNCKTGVNLNTSINLVGTDSGDYVKALVFNDFGTIYPLAKSVTLNPPAYVPEETLLSNNIDCTTLFPNQSVFTTGAKKEWVCKGTHSTNPNLVGSLDKLTDGYITEGNYAITDNSSSDAYGNVLFDLKDIYKITKTRFWVNNSALSGVGNIDIFGSTDGISFNNIASKVVQSTSNRYIMVEVSVAPVAFSRYIKIIFSKGKEKQNMQIGEIAIYGMREDSVILNGNYTWSRELPFATTDDILWDSWRLTDDDYLQEAGTNGKYTSVIFDLQDYYQVGNISIVADGLAGCEAQFSVDGEKYFSTGYRISNTAGSPGLNARYVKLIMHKKNDQWLLIREVDMEGYRLYDTNAPVNSTPQPIHLSANVKNSSIVYLDWSSYNQQANSVQSYAVYMDTVDFITVGGKNLVQTYETGNPVLKSYQTEKFCTYMGLSPNTTYYVAVVPVINNGIANFNVQTVNFTTPSALGNDKVGGIFNINEFPYGGGAHVNHLDESSNLENKLKLLAELDGIQNSRWFNHTSQMLEKYGSYGVGFHLFYDGNALISDNKLGKWTFSTGNEPEGAGITTKDYADSIIANYIDMKSKNPKSLLCEPSLLGTEQSSLDYLDALYKTSTGFKDYFDVMDVHPYVKKENGNSDGLPSLGMPELLPQKIIDLKRVMSINNDGLKPIIFTELGWSTFTEPANPTEWVMVPLSYDKQSDYLVRAYLHSIAKGIKQVYWYAFQDEGTERNVREQNFGIVDWYGNPKPAYYGYYTMARILKDSQFLRIIEGLQPLNFAYEFWDEGKNQYITAIWTATELNKQFTISSEGDITVVGSDQSFCNFKSSGTISITGTPVFVYSKGSLEIIDI